MRGVQGAALRRQRSRLEAHRRDTLGSLSELAQPPPPPPPPLADVHAPSSGGLFGLTLFHIGLVFLFIGFLMVITAMIPGYMETAEAYDLVGTGTFFVVLGGVLTLVNRVLAKREDDSLKKYVSGRLARSKSGGRLVRDPESGLTPEIHRRYRRRPSRASHSPDPSAKQCGELARLAEEPPDEPAAGDKATLVVNDVHVHMSSDAGGGGGSERTTPRANSDHARPV